MNIAVFIKNSSTVFERTGWFFFLVIICTYQQAWLALLCLLVVVMLMAGYGFEFPLFERKYIHSSCFGCFLCVKGTRSMCGGLFVLFLYVQLPTDARLRSACCDRTAVR